MKAAQEAASKHSAGPCGSLLSRTGTTARNGNEGIGKPEPLKHGFQDYWSRRINDEHRLIYKATEDGALIAQCRYHYES